MDDLSRTEIVARYGKYFKLRGLFGKPEITIGVQGFPLHDEDLEDDDYQDVQGYREWLREMVCVALDNLVRAESADVLEALQARVAEARNAALEEAARVADTCKSQNGPLSARGFENNYRAGIESGAEAIAAAIRAMKDAPTGTPPSSSHP